MKHVLQRRFTDPRTGVTKVYRYTVKTHHWLPRLTPWHEYGITIFSTVYCLHNCPAGLHAHEFRHVVQWDTYGLLFLAYYLRDMVCKGYRNNWAEREARQYRADHAHHFTDLA
jgi:hypothetical protein